MPSPQEIESKTKTYLAAWNEHAATATFAAPTLEQFTALVQPSLDARAKIKALDEQRRTLENRRDDADKASAQAIKDVSKAIAGDKKYGTNSTLWEQTGHVRDNERASGLTRKHVETGGTPASPPAAARRRRGCRPVFGRANRSPHASVKRNLLRLSLRMFV